MKEIVILGGGFAGIATAMALKKYQGENLFHITLIDKHNYPLFTPSLYEVATSEEPQGNIAIPFWEIFKDSITYFNASVSTINAGDKTINLANGDNIKYDYLVISLGSQAAYYGIPGLKEHSIPLKTLKDAVEIKNKIKSLCCKEGKCHKKVQLIIGGGGLSGSELAAEMLTYKNRLSRQHYLDTDCLEISILQGSDRLLKELDSRVSNIAEKRVKSPQVKLCFGGHIKEVNDTKVVVDDGHEYSYDILIWTGGVEASTVLKESGLPIDKRGQLPVDEHMQVIGLDNVFAGGDVASFIDPKTQKPEPGLAQTAEEEGKIICENLYRKLKELSLVTYQHHHLGYIVPLRGRFAVAELAFGIKLIGFPAWVLQQFVFLRYLLGILPFAKATRKWNKFEIDLNMPHND